MSKLRFAVVVCGALVVGTVTGTANAAALNAHHHPVATAGHGRGAHAGKGRGLEIWCPPSGQHYLWCVGGGAK